MMRRILGSLAAVGLMLGLHGCLSGGNSGSETTNGLAGVVKNSEGKPVQGARVFLLPENFNPESGGSSVDSLQTSTDAHGGYLFPDVAPGRYHLEFSDSISGTLALLQGIT